MRNYLKRLSFLIFLVLPVAAHAQHTPIQGAVGGATGNSYESVADDILRSFISKHRNDSGVGKQGGFTIDAFATGRIRTTDHDGYEATTLERSVPFTADEWSLFGSAGYSSRGWHPNSRYSVGIFVGLTELDIAMQKQPLAGIFVAPGTATNSAIQYGFSGVYSVGSFYTAASVTGLSGETDITDTLNGFTPKYDTNGVMVRAVAGGSSQVGIVKNTRIYATLEGGIRYLDFKGDSYLSATGLTTFQSLYSSTTASILSELFTVVQSGGVIFKPFVRNTLMFDINYDHVALATDANGREVTKLDRKAVANKTELGITGKSGNMGFLFAGYGEFAEDRSTWGGRFGVKINLN